MCSKKLIFFLYIIFFCYSCSNKTIEKSEITETNLELQMIEAYREGMEELNKGDVLFAAKKFNEAEVLYPQSDLAPKAALMAAYSYYSQNYYSDAIAELERFLKVYFNHKDSAYAKYLLALCYYEQIIDEKKDLNSIEQSKKIFTQLIEDFPNTEYADDANFKLNLINDTLASKEMYIGRFYLEKKKWIAAINRFKFILENYDTTIYTEEAIHRLVEVYYLLGLDIEAKKYANLLGYNYQSSQWYKRSYYLFNKNYEPLKIKKDKSNVLNKLKSIFD